MTNATTTIPHSAVDVFSEEVMADPYPVFRGLREAGPVVYLEQFDVFAVPRYQQCREVLGNWESFSSADIALNPQFSQYVGDGILRSDPPLHDQQRGVLSERLAPRALRELKPEVDRRAAELVGRIVAQGSFDAVTDLARRFPLELVADLIGLPAEGRESLLELMDANFNCFGPDNARSRESGPKLGALAEYVMTKAGPESLAEGSMGHAVYEAVEAGHVPAEAAPWLVMTYVTAGVDTTVHALGHAIWLLGTHPEQWAALRQRQSLIPQAFREVLRYETPVQLFGRTARLDWSVGDYVVPAGSRLAVLFGSANRDESKWPEADRFDIGRDNIDHLGFGYGLHGCAGQALARLEGEAILEALVGTVDKINVGQPVRHYNNVLRGLESLPVTVTAG
jgi:cytochrome P450